MMDVTISAGDVLDAHAQGAEVLICPANVQLNLSGGVSGEVLLRGGESIQRELHQWLKLGGKPNVERGSVVPTAAGQLPFVAILHAVAIDAFYTTTVEQLADTIGKALRAAADADCESVAMPALATGYGRMPIAAFGQAFRMAVSSAHPEALPARCLLVMRTESDAAELRAAMGSDAT